PQQPLCRPRKYRRGIPPRPKSLSVRKKSPTSAWGRSTSSTRKTPERPDLGKNSPEAAAAAAGAADAAEAAAAAAAAAAAEAAAAAWRGEFAVSARGGALRLRCKRKAMAGLTRFDPANYVLFAAPHDGRVDGQS